MIKFKEAGNGHFIRISLDEEGNELSRTATFSEASKPKTMGAGFFAEKNKWVEDGGVVEAQYTAEEQTAKDQAEAEKDLGSQQDLCQRYLNETDYKLLSDFEYQDDVPALLVLRIEWKRIIKSDQTEAVPDKPYEDP